MDWEREQLNSALYWFPRIADTSPVPRTEFVGYDHQGVLGNLGKDGEINPNLLPVIEVQRVAGEMGYPVFIRTDLASAKHSGAGAYRADGKEDVERVLTRTVEDSEMKFWLSPIRPKAFMVREWLDLDYAFVAFGFGGRRGHRIAAEMRVFVDTNNAPICEHFYWPEESIRFGGKTGEPLWWRGRLQGLRLSISHREIAVLRSLARSASARCDAHPRWSVDFARTAPWGVWWLIDMAIAERSWHPADCPHYKPNCNLEERYGEKAHG